MSACVSSNFEILKSGINQSLFLEMFDQFYDDQVEMVQNGASVVGKVENRVNQVNFINNAKINKIEIISHTVGDDDTVTYEMLMDLEVGNHVINKNQRIIQKWKNGKVIREEYL